MKRERLCNSGTIPVAVTSTTKAAQSPPLPPAGDGKACRPERVRRPAVLPSFGAFRVEEPDDAICPAGIICPYRRGRCRIAFIPATPQPKSPFPTVTGHGASVRSAGSAAEDDSTGIVAMKGGEETLRNASPTGFHADARPKISHPLPSDACQL